MRADRPGGVGRRPDHPDRAAGVRRPSRRPAGSGADRARAEPDEARARGDALRAGLRAGPGPGAWRSPGAGGGTAEPKARGAGRAGRPGRLEPGRAPGAGRLPEERRHPAARPDRGGLGSGWRPRCSPRRRWRSSSRWYGGPVAPRPISPAMQWRWSRWGPSRTARLPDTWRGSLTWAWSGQTRARPRWRKPSITGTFSPWPRRWASCTAAP